MTAIVTASVICMNQNYIGRDVKACLDAGIDHFHIDPMDGMYVPRLGMYPEQVRYIKEEFPNTVIDVHTMLTEPNKYVKEFLDAGSDIVMMHSENQKNLYGTLGLINSYGRKAGVCLNIATDVNFLKMLKDEIYVVMLMGFNPGILNQELWPGLYDKIKAVKDVTDGKVKVMIDGGVKFYTARQLQDAGADYLVGGSSTVFHKDGTVAQNVKKINEVLNG
jgi:ribulose-phosphate 3-epimerase